MLHRPSLPRGPDVAVWDPFVRIFHWTVVLAFIVVYLVEDPHIVHVWAGYVIAAMLIVRVIWGFVGSKHARFSDFLYAPSTAFAYVRDLLRMHGKRYLGHSPAGGYMKRLRGIEPRQLGLMDPFL